MSRYLLDENTVLALLDRKHVFHDAAHAWAASLPKSARWLTSPAVVICGTAILLWSLNHLLRRLATFNRGHV